MSLKLTKWFISPSTITHGVINTLAFHVKDISNIESGDNLFKIMTLGVIIRLLTSPEGWKLNKKQWSCKPTTDNKSQPYEFNPPIFYYIYNSNSNFINTKKSFTNNPISPREHYTIPSTMRSYNYNFLSNPINFLKINNFNSRGLWSSSWFKSSSSNNTILWKWPNKNPIN